MVGGKVESRLTANCTGSFWGDGSILELDRSNGCTVRWLCWEPLKCTFKIVDFMLCEEYLNLKMLLK